MNLPLFILFSSFQISWSLLPYSFSNSSLLCSAKAIDEGSQISEGSIVLSSKPPLKVLRRSRSYEGNLNAVVNLTCLTRGLPHDWKAPKEALKSISFYSSEDIYDFIRTLHHATNSSFNPEGVNDLHLSSLSLPQLKHYHVGSYECRPQQSSDDGAEGEAGNSFYLFVRDNRRPYALDSQITYISAEEGTNAYIPCRPSYREIRVRLERVENPGVSLQELSFSFKKGFLLRNISIEFDEGLYRCLFTSSRVRDAFRDVQLSVLPRVPNDTVISMADTPFIPNVFILAWVALYNQWVSLRNSLGI